MSHTYSAQSMVTLPRLNAQLTVVLGTETLTAASDQETKLQATGQSLPTPIARSRTRLASALATLMAVLQPIPSTIDSAAARNADMSLDRAWSGFLSFLTSWQKMPAGIDSDPAGTQALVDLCFAQGLSFLTLDYRTEWQESEVRLQAIAGNGAYLDTLNRLGGSSILQGLRQAHAAYGAVLGITSVKVEESSPQVRSSRDAVIAALRDYVLKVAAWADPEEPGSTQLSDALLQPLEVWESPETASSEASGEAPAAELNATSTSSTTPAPSPTVGTAASPAAPA